MENTASTTSQFQAVPVDQSNRILIIDSLRGIAILGILLINIPSFGLAARDPSILNESGINYSAWWYINWIPEGTQRALFSMLFGAGIILFISGQEKRLPGMLPADYFFRRQLWLILFSVFDVFILLWQGDILLDYACFGMIMFVFRNLPPRKLLWGAGICFIFMVARENRNLYLDKSIISKGENIALLDTTTTRLNPLQKDAVNAMMDFKKSTTSEARLKRSEKNILKVSGDYGDLYTFRTDNYVNDIVEYLYFGLWDVLFCMFLGMAFFKMGILTGKSPVSVYLWMCIIGLTVGLLISYYRLQPLIKNNFDWYEYTKSISFESYSVSRLFRTLGIFGLIMLMYKSGWFKWLFALLRPVGQMAFTNYLLQSLICSIIFNGIGLGLYGQLERYQVYLVVFGIWIFQIILSHIWLRNFRFGPFEWTWRSLTYWKLQPMKK